MGPVAGGRSGNTFRLASGPPVVVGAPVPGRRPEKCPRAPGAVLRAQADPGRARTDRLAPRPLSLATERPGQEENQGLAHARRDVPALGLSGGQAPVLVVAERRAPRVTLAPELALAVAPDQRLVVVTEPTPRPDSMGQPAGSNDGEVLCPALVPWRPALMGQME